jgi:rSAM/selenodomain-associated transferase 1
MQATNRLSGETTSVECPGNGRDRARRSDGACAIAIMAKASAPGRTKTRLVPPLTFEQAAALNTTFIQDIAGNLLAAGSRIAIAGYVAFAPAGAEAFFRDALPSDIGLIDACLPSLGECLVKEIFARGHAAAVVLNSDSPTLPTALLIETASMLAQPGERAVLGPCTDGGYYLLGLKTFHRRLFEDITWGTARVAAQTLERAREVKLDVHLLPPWYDVDDVEGLRRLHGELASARAGQAKSDPHTPYFPAATATLMRNLTAGALIRDQLENDRQIPPGSA